MAILFRLCALFMRLEQREFHKARLCSVFAILIFASCWRFVCAEARAASSKELGQMHILMRLGLYAQKSRVIIAQTPHAEISFEHQRKSVLGSFAYCGYKVITV